MKKNLFYVVAVFLCIFTRYAYASHEDWYRCQTAGDCVLVNSTCGVEWAANKKFSEETKKVPPRVDDPCKKPLEFHPANTSTLCVDSKCALYPGGSFAGGRPIEPDNCIVSSCWGHLGCNYLTCTREDGSTYNKFAQ